MDEHSEHTVSNPLSASDTLPFHLAHFIIGGIIVAAIVIPIFFIRFRRFKAESKKKLVSTVHTDKLTADIVINGIDDGVLLIDTEGVIKIFNPAAERITGWKNKDAIGIDYHLVMQLVGSKGEPFKNDPLSKVFSEKTTVRENNAFLKLRDNHTISLGISAYPLTDHANALIGSLVILQDITNTKEQEKRRADFISTASHEMRTPVAAIEGYLALALNDKVSNIDSKARDYLEKAHSSTQSLGKLFQDLLTSAKAEDGRLVNHPAVIEMGEFLEKLTDSLRFTAEKKGLLMDLVTGINDGAEASGVGGGKVVRPFYYVHVDPDRLSEVIVNLFDNAVKYTETGKVVIGLTGNNEVVQMYIHDTGPGIPTEDLPHLFQKFYRVDNSATRTIGGTGLGLFICRKIVELYNGRIWVESELGKGSTFYINLPRLTSQRASELQAVEAAQLPPVPSASA